MANCCQPINSGCRAIALALYDLTLQHYIQVSAALRSSNSYFTTDDLRAALLYECFQSSSRLRYTAQGGYLQRRSGISTYGWSK